MLMNEGQGPSLQLNIHPRSILKGWRLVPNPALFGRAPAFVFAEAGSQASKDRLISELLRMDGVVVITSFYGSGLVISLFDDSRRSASKWIERLGTNPMSDVGGVNLPPMNPAFRAGPTDWQIVKAMLADADRDASEVAGEIRASGRTVRRRLNKMLEARAVFFFPIVELGKTQGVSFQLLVEPEAVHRAEVDRQVRLKIKNLVFRAGTNRVSTYGFNGANVAEVQSVLRQVRDLPGVKSVTLSLVEEIVHAFDWLKKEVDSNARFTGHGAPRARQAR